MAKRETILYGSPGIVTLSDAMGKLFSDQLSLWPLARKNISALKNLKTRQLAIGSVQCQLLLNPARAISTKAKLDERSIKERPCFLCRENRPSEQLHIGFEGAKGKKYDIFVNPFPVLANHFVVASDTHVPQAIWHRYVDMLRLCKRAGAFTILYNGPRSGASAPDHFHFQAIPSGLLPLENYVSDQIDNRSLKLLTKIRDAQLYQLSGYLRGSFVIVSDSSKSASKLFYKLMDCSKVPDGDGEPRINVFSFRRAGRYVSVVVMRSSHRSSHYFTEDASRHLAMSPGCVDMGGVIVAVEKEDFNKINTSLLKEMMDEVTLTKEDEEDIIKRLKRTQAQVKLEILSSDTIEFEVLSYGAGRRVAKYRDGKVEYGGQLYDEVIFDQRVSSTIFSEPSFALHQPDGICKYAGGLEIRVDGDKLKAINVIGVEDYLLSRISDNMPEGCLEDSVKKRRKLILQSTGPYADPEYHGFSDTIDEEVREAIDSTWGMTD